jgi:hypothetical protein
VGNFQLDGGPFDWLEGRGPAMTLLEAIDDATSVVVAVHFRPTEDLHGYATLFQQIFATARLPVALYGDGVNILVRTDPHWTLDEHSPGRKRPPTWAASSRSSASGMSEPAPPRPKAASSGSGTLQDRLVSELRLRLLATRAAANAFLPEFLADFNSRFARPALSPHPARRRPPRDLALVLSCRYQRVVARDNTVRLGPRLI